MLAICFVCESIIEDDEVCSEVILDGVAGFVHSKCEAVYYEEHDVFCSVCQERIHSDGVWIHNNPLHLDCRNEHDDSTKSDSSEQDMIRSGSKDVNLENVNNDDSESVSLGSSAEDSLGSSSNSLQHLMETSTDKNQMYFVHESDDVDVLKSSSSLSHHSDDETCSNHSQHQQSSSSTGSGCEVVVTECKYCGDLLDEDYRVYSTGEENIVLHAYCLDKYTEEHGPFCVFCSKLLDGECVQVSDTSTGKTEGLFHLDCISQFKQNSLPLCDQCESDITDNGVQYTQGDETFNLHKDCLELFKEDNCPWCSHCDQLLLGSYFEVGLGRTIKLHKKCLEEFKQAIVSQCEYCEGIIQQHCMVLGEGKNAVHLHADCVQPHRIANAPVCSQCCQLCLESCMAIEREEYYVYLHHECVKEYQQEYQTPQF